MHRTAVRSDGTIALGPDAARAGYRPGTLVDVIVTCTGSLIVAIDQSPPPLDVTFRPLEGGTAQLAARSLAAG